MMSAEIESILFQEGEVVKFEKEDIEDLGIFIEEISAGLNKRAGDAVKIGDDGGERVDPSLNERVGSSSNNLKKSGEVEEMFSDDDKWILETTTQGGIFPSKVARILQGSLELSGEVLSKNHALLSRF